MKLVKMALVGILLIAVVVASISCTNKSQTSTTGSSVATVQRGNLEINIVASGNLAYTDKEDLAFEIGGTIGGANGTQLTVEEVLVDEGDTVKKGQVLARLDDSAWQDYLDTLKNSLTTAQRSQTAKERTLTAKQRLVDTKQSDLESAQRQVATRELALRQAQLSLQTAQYNLGQIADIKTAQNAVDKAEANYLIAQVNLENARRAGDQSDQIELLTKALTAARKELEGVRDPVTKKVIEPGARDMLNQLLDANNWDKTTDASLQILSKVLAVDTAQKTVDDAQVAIDTAKTAVVNARTALDDSRLDVDDAKVSVDDAKKSVADAQKTLDEASAKSTQVVAPFDGFITAVNVKGGGAVNKGTIACVIADPNKFECNNILVSEMDISKLKLDGAATVAVDSLGLSFPAKVASIAPTATVQQGVVNFKVKVELQSLTPVQSTTAASSAGQTSGQARQGAVPGQTSGQPRQTVTPGSLTPEQMAALAERIRQGASGQQAAAPSASTPSFQLREGLTVTVNIVVDKKTNVLTVPNRAITTEGRQAYVQVILPDGKTEKRAITKGISDYQNTEVVQGLDEGEKVMIIKSTATSTSSSTSQQRPNQPILIPGMGGR